MESRIVAAEAEVARVRAGSVLGVHLALAHPAVIEEGLLGRAEKGVLEGFVT